MGMMFVVPVGFGFLLFCVAVALYGRAADWFYRKTGVWLGFILAFFFLCAFFYVGGMDLFTQRYY